MIYERVRGAVVRLSVRQVFAAFPSLSLSLSLSIELARCPCQIRSAPLTAVYMASHVYVADTPYALALSSSLLLLLSPR